MNKVIQSISLDAKLLYERMAKSSVGDVIEYAELSAIIGRDVQNGARGLMETARRKALRDNQMLFGVLMNTGLKRLNDVEIAAIGPHTVRRIRRIAGRGINAYTALSDFNGLPNASKVCFNAHTSLLGAILHGTKSGSVKRIEAKVAESMATLPLAKTLEAFRG